MLVGDCYLCMLYFLCVVYVSFSVHPPFVLRLFSVDPPFVLRSSSVRRSKNERRIIEEISENHRRQDGDVSKL